ncbi:hypothetical protein SDC9_85440 [bioreactor metagenome]|uniref:Uncharacterized protein n=1 Tax=bioreactor metagenome TaxID=1076179 RepID=A0A644ZD61_9ZZZZ
MRHEKFRVQVFVEIVKAVVFSIDVYDHGAGCGVIHVHAFHKAGDKRIADARGGPILAAVAEHQRREGFKLVIIPERIRHVALAVTRAEVDAQRFLGVDNRTRAFGFYARRKGYAQFAVRFVIRKVGKALHFFVLVVHAHDFVDSFRVAGNADHRNRMRLNEKVCRGCDIADEFSGNDRNSAQWRALGNRDRTGV